MTLLGYYLNPSRKVWSPFTSYKLFLVKDHMPKINVLLNVKCLNGKWPIQTWLSHCLGGKYYMLYIFCWVCEACMSRRRVTNKFAQPQGRDPTRSCEKRSLSLTWPCVINANWLPGWPLSNRSRKQGNEKISLSISILPSRLMMACHRLTCLLGASQHLCVWYGQKRRRGLASCSGLLTSILWANTSKEHGASSDSDRMSPRGEGVTGRGTLVCMYCLEGGGGGGGGGADSGRWEQNGPPSSPDPLSRHPKPPARQQIFGNNIRRRDVESTLETNIQTCWSDVLFTWLKLFTLTWICQQFLSAGVESGAVQAFIKGREGRVMSFAHTDMHTITTLTLPRAPWWSGRYGGIWQAMVDHRQNT